MRTDKFGYPIEMEIKILEVIDHDNHYERKTLGKAIKEEFGQLGYKRLQMFWKNGFIGYGRLWGVRLTKKGFKYYCNMREELRKVEE